MRYLDSATLFKLFTAASLLLCGWLTANAQAAPGPIGEPQLNLARTVITAGVHRIDAQVAATPEQRQVGLMHRKTMPANEGMLFVFEAAHKQCFWMRNTLLPLTIAFLDDEGRIVNMADMQPLSDQSHCSSEPVRYVLEMNQGWFKKRGLKAGDKLVSQPVKP